MKKMRLFRDERGVAMITVILVAAVMTVVATTAATITITDFRSGKDDRKAAEALAYGESGVDRFMQQIRKYTWGHLNQAGCEEAPIDVPMGDLGSGRFYNAYLTVFNPQLAQADRLPNLNGWEPGSTTWDGTANSGAEVCTTRPDAPPPPGDAGEKAYFAITSVGEHPAARRVVRQVVTIGAMGLPIGLYADTVNVQGGTPTTLDISLVTPGNVEGREKLNFSGTDPYYKLGHFWSGLSMETPAPAAVHALGEIKCHKNYCGNDGVEHPAALECRANGLDNGQSQWDQSGGGGPLGSFSACAKWTGTPSGLPPTSLFTAEDLERARPKPNLDDQDYAALKQLAKSDGMYCTMGADGKGTCTKPTGSFSTNGTIQDGDLAGLGNTFIAFVDYPSNVDPFDTKSTLTWKAALGPCSDDKAVNRNVVIIVRNGSLDLTGKDEIVGAFLAPEGKIWMRGSGGIVKIHGTAIAKEIDFGGNAEVKLSECWVNNMPGAMLQIQPATWSEVDRG